VSITTRGSRRSEARYARYGYRALLVCLGSDFFQLVATKTPGTPRLSAAALPAGD